MLQEKLKPLKISCTSSDCGNGLHCFRATQKMKRNNQGGRCRKCGLELIDWNRIHKRDLSDVGNTFMALKKELVRHHFWHLEIDVKAINHAHRKGKSKLRDAVEQRIRKSVSSVAPSFDGRQTPTDGNIIFYAQHATACCCRKCMEYWHNIPPGRALTGEEMAYFIELVWLYITDRLPSLPDEGEKVPPMRKCS